VLILQSLLYSSALLGGSGGRGNTWMRTFPLLRVAKVLRILRVVKFCTQLYLIVSAVIGSIMQMFWSVLTFAIVFFIFSLFILSNVVNYMQALDSVHSEEARSVILYFGSFEVTLRTLFLTLAGGSDWEEYYFALEPVRNGQLVFTLFVVFSQLVLLNVVTSMFVESTMKLSKPDFKQLAEEHYAEEREYATELKKLFEAADVDQNCYIDRLEFDAMVSDGKFATAFKFLNIDPTWARNNLPSLYDALAEQHMVRTPGNGAVGIDINVLTERIMALRGFARSTEVMDLHDMVWQLARRQEEMMSVMGGAVLDGMQATNSAKQSVTDFTYQPGVWTVQPKDAAVGKKSSTTVRVAVSPSPSNDSSSSGSSSSES